MDKHPQRVPAGEFKARCLQLMDEVEATGAEVVITKRGRPVARLVPVAPAPRAELYGCMAGQVTVVADIVGPIGEAWEVEGG